MKVIPLELGVFQVNTNGSFSRWDQKSPSEGLTMSIQPFLIETERDLILVDLGIELDEFKSPLILQILDRQGYRPSQITKVLLSHLHLDHLMGLGRFENQQFVFNFPNAKVFVQKRELDMALQNHDSSSYDIRLLKALKSLPQAIFLEQNEGWISDEIRFEVSGGHTPYHQEFWFYAENQIVFYGGDNLPLYSYLRRQVAYKSDFDGRMASFHRKQWKQRAKAENWKILFYHDFKRPIVQIE